MRTHIHVNERCRWKEERSKQGHTNNKAKQHNTPKAVTFPNKNELPRVGLEPTTLYTLDRVLYQLIQPHTPTLMSPLFHPSSYGGHSHSGGGGGGGGEDHGSSGYGGPPPSSDMYSNVTTDDQYYSSFADNCTSPYCVCSLMPCFYGWLLRPCCGGC